MPLPGLRVLPWSRWRRSPPRALIHPASLSLGPRLALMKCTFLHTVFFSSVVCLVLCAFINREQRLRGLSRLKTPWCFIFSLLPPSISRKRTVLWLKGSLFVKLSRLHSLALWPFSPPPRLSRGERDPAQRQDRARWGLGRDGAGHCSCPDAFPGAGPPASCSCCRLHDI